MANVIQDLRNTLGRGARTNKFEIQFHPLAGLGAPAELREIGSLLAKSASFPGKTINSAEAFLRGRKTLLQGMTDYGNTWEVTFYETLDHQVRTWFGLWMRLMDDDVTDSHNHVYLSSANVSQLDKNNNKGGFAADGNYTLLNVWPQSISESTIDSSTPSEIMTVTVTFAFDSYVPLDLQV